LKQPYVKEPIEPEKQMVKNEDGDYTMQVTKFTQTVFHERVKQRIKETNSLKATTQSLYNVVWGQCSKLMQNKLKAVPNIQTLENEGNVTTLLKEIRGISHQLESNTSIYDSLDEAKRRFYAYRQGEDDSNAQHLQNFKTTVEVIEHFGGNIFYNDALINFEKDKDRKNPNIDMNNGDHNDTHYQRVVRDKMMVVAFLKQANTHRYEPLMLSIWEHFVFGNDVYPASLNAAYELLENFNQSHRKQDNRSQLSGGGRGNGRNNQQGRQGGRGDGAPPRNTVIGLQYSQDTEIVPGIDGCCVPHITCWRCYKKGHFVRVRVRVRVIAIALQYK
jgi:hypothetical protein